MSLEKTYSHRLDKAKNTNLTLNLTLKLILKCFGSSYYVFDVLLAPWSCFLALNSVSHNH